MAYTTLVIAAAGVEGTTRGLFFSTRSRRPLEGIIAMPYLPANFPTGTFSIAITSRLAANPYTHSCPLKNRVWVFQEWYLARRIVFFMPGDIGTASKPVYLSGVVPSYISGAVQGGFSFWKNTVDGG